MPASWYQALFKLKSFCNHKSRLLVVIKKNAAMRHISDLETTLIFYLQDWAPRGSSSRLRHNQPTQTRVCLYYQYLLDSLRLNSHKFFCIYQNFYYSRLCISNISTHTIWHLEEALNYLLLCFIIIYSSYPCILFLFVSSLFFDFFVVFLLWLLHFIHWLQILRVWEVDKNDPLGRPCSEILFHEHYGCNHCSNNGGPNFFLWSQKLPPGGH